jgi:hypothetical protein
LPAMAKKTRRKRTLSTNKENRSVAFIYVYVYGSISVSSIHAHCVAGAATNTIVLAGEFRMPRHFQRLGVVGKTTGRYSRLWHGLFAKGFPPTGGSMGTTPNGVCCCKAGGHGHVTTAQDKTRRTTD